MMGEGEKRNRKFKKKEREERKRREEERKALEEEDWWSGDTYKGKSFKLSKVTYTLNRFFYHLLIRNQEMMIYY